MTPISNLTLYIKDGSTTSSTEIYGTDKKTYFNIGSGNVFKLYWNTPTLTNDSVDYYKLTIKRHDITLNVYYDIFDKNIGLVNEFCVDSIMLPTVPEQYKLSIYLVAYGKLGNAITSNVITPYVSKGSGIYVKVEDGYAQPIMKRAIAFESGPTPVDATAVVVNEAGHEVTILDADGNSVRLDATRLLSSSDWRTAQESYTKATDGSWCINDIKYEVLVGLGDGEIITDINNEPIYVL